MGQIKNIKLHIVTDIKKSALADTQNNTTQNEEEQQRLLISPKVPKGLLRRTEQCAQKVDVCPPLERTSIQVLGPISHQVRLGDGWSEEGLPGCCRQQPLDG